MKSVIRTTCFALFLLFINFFEGVYEKFGSAHASETNILEILVQGAKRIDPENRRTQRAFNDSLFISLTLDKDEPLAFLSPRNTTQPGCNPHHKWIEQLVYHPAFPQISGLRLVIEFSRPFPNHFCNVWYQRILIFSASHGCRSRKTFTSSPLHIKVLTV